VTGEESWDAYMAKKDKAKEPDDESDGEDAEGQGTEGEAGSKKGLRKFLTRKILMIAVPALILVLGGGGAGAYFLLLKPHDASGAKLADAPPLTPPQVAFSDVPDILVNIQSNDGTPAYLKLSLSLEMDNDLEKTGMTALMPRLVDQFQSYLRELRIDDLKGSEGVLRLKEELLRRVNTAAAPYKVRDVLLKQMIVQ
jgi:flagellar FliL protein